MYYRERNLTCRKEGSIGTFRETSFREIKDYIMERAPEDGLEIVPGHYYHGKYGLEFLVLKDLGDNRLIAKLREGQTLTLPLTCLDEEDAHYYGVTYSSGLFLIQKRLLKERVTDINKWGGAILTVHGFTILDDFHWVGRGGYLIDLELFLISMKVIVAEPMRQFGTGIEHRPSVSWRIITEGSRSENHIIGEDGTLRLELKFPGEYIMKEDVKYFELHYDNSFSINQETGETVGRRIIVKEVPFTLPESYFTEDRWRDTEISF